MLVSINNGPSLVNDDAACVIRVSISGLGPSLHLLYNYSAISVKLLSKGTFTQAIFVAAT